jgi:hypothetical protein
LAPPRPAQPAGQRELPAPEVLLQLHASFRAATAGAGAAEADALLGAEPPAQQLAELRQRWRRQRQAAMGLLQQRRQQQQPGAAHETDVLDPGGAGPGLEAWEALDGSCATDLLHEQDLQPVLLGKRSWACSSPMTGSTWKRGRSAIV